MIGTTLSHYTVLEKLGEAPAFLLKTSGAGAIRGIAVEVEPFRHVASSSLGHAVSCREPAVLLYTAAPAPVGPPTARRVGGGDLSSPPGAVQFSGAFLEWGEREL